ncbi:hypothetical protein ANOM_005123 [Aspergillus nomiae NRRL 13137]|uniref:Peroxisomal membrane protein receptor Pex19 n=1 Tax=Aspergillus nomiae NRRL (strain ATCC 15546 / NRRL 13137 / CBS 260.88 / M93) TaxID=1509407 RepID=A0A0L1J429_ASPN3|nr:uncharacterized protein ANOM_005123 [Aspergillus nomiae NRRL 13137]KNG86482.1 hypothetical protein ANOM_005123 [Aspergillus nomiae NRRL 13137]
MALNNEFNTTLPFIGSHEPAGVIEEVGSEVTGFQRGDRVGCINFDSVCGKCADCKAGLPIYCEAPLMKGITTDGGWAEYMVAIYGGIVRADVPEGGSIGIVGIGGLDHLGTQVAKCMGYKVAAIDVKQSALDAVASYEHSPDVLILATDPVEKSLDKINGMISSDYPGLDATVLATDHPAAFELAAALTRKHGTMVLLGQPEKGITMSYQTVIYKDIKLVGSLVADTAQAQELVELFHRNRLHVEITEWKMEEAEQMRQCRGDRHWLGISAQSQKRAVTKHPSALFLSLLHTTPLLGLFNSQTSRRKRLRADYNRLRIPSQVITASLPLPRLFGIMSTPSASPVNAGDPQQNESAPVTTSAENVNTAAATTTAAAVPETPAQSADKPQAQPQQPKQAIDDDDDDESDLDELDDMASMMGHAAKESGASDDKGFEDTINQGADAFTKQLEESGIPPGDFLKQLLADVMAEEEGGDASAGAAAAPSTGSAGSSSGGAGAGAPPESFNDAIQQTMNRMKDSGDKATAAASEDDGDDMLANLIKALQTTGLDPDEEDGGLMNVVAAMMEQLSNKEMLYEPMKELDAKFGPWLVENKGKEKFSDEEMERFEKQATIASQIVAKFEEPGYTDEDAKCREYVWGKMQEMQAAGSPPEELVANPFGQDLKGPGGMPMPDCTQQ